jgi:hypothetical protein
MATKAGVGMSYHHDPNVAGREAAEQALEKAGISKPDFVFIFASAGYDQHSLVRAVRETTGGASLAGLQALFMIGVFSIWYLRVRRTAKLVEMEESDRVAYIRNEEGDHTGYINLAYARSVALSAIFVIAVITSAAATYGGASYAASRIKAAETPAVDVRYRSFSGSADPVTTSGLQHIGATQKFAFFYDVNDKDNEKDNHTLVIPQAQIVSIKVPE